MQDKHLEIRGHFTDLIVGNRTFHYQTDMEAIEMAESLPECVNWQVKLQYDKGVIDSRKYRETKPAENTR